MLRRNWKKGKCRVSQFETKESRARDDDDIYFKMNDTQIVRYTKSAHSTGAGFLIYNRWTLELEHVSILSYTS